VTENGCKTISSYTDFPKRIGNAGARRCSRTNIRHFADRSDTEKRRCESTTQEDGQWIRGGTLTHDNERHPSRRPRPGSGRLRQPPKKDSPRKLDAGRKACQRDAVQSTDAQSGTACWHWWRCCCLAVGLSHSHLCRHFIVFVSGPCSLVSR